MAIHPSLPHRESHSHLPRLNTMKLTYGPPLLPPFQVMDAEWVGIEGSSLSFYR